MVYNNNNNNNNNVLTENVECRLAYRVQHVI